MFSEPDQVPTLNKSLYLALRIMMVASAVALVPYTGVKKQSRIAFAQNTYFPAVTGVLVGRHLAGAMMCGRITRDRAVGTQ